MVLESVLVVFWEFNLVIDQINVFFMFFKIFGYEKGEFLVIMEIVFNLFYDEDKFIIF